MKKSGEASGMVTFSFPMYQLIAKVSVFCNRSLSSSSSIENFSKHRDGRIVSMNLILKTANISLCNVYA